VKHHLKHTISDPRNSVLFVGYQAVGTLGRRIESGETPIRMFGDWYDVRAEVATIEGFSAHADLDELIEWFDGLDGSPAHTFVVHGEENAALSFARELRERSAGDVQVPERDQIFQLDS
jgi:metallo-beta-lactamase family protein